MSKRAEEYANAQYPQRWVNKTPTSSEKVDYNEHARWAARIAYEQAEKDIIVLIESRLSELLGDAQPTPILRYELQDLIKKIKEEG